MEAWLKTRLGCHKGGQVRSQGHKSSSVSRDWVRPPNHSWNHQGEWSPRGLPWCLGQSLPWFYNPLPSQKDRKKSTKPHVN